MRPLLLALAHGGAGQGIESRARYEPLIDFGGLVAVLSNLDHDRALVTRRVLVDLGAISADIHHGETVGIGHDRCGGQILHFFLKRRDFDEHALYARVAGIRNVFGDVEHLELDRGLGGDVDAKRLDLVLSRGLGRSEQIELTGLVGNRGERKTRRHEPAHRKERTTRKGDGISCHGCSPNYKGRKQRYTDKNCTDLPVDCCHDYLNRPLTRC